MPPEWYYAKNKQKVGPVTEAQLKVLLRSGELARNDMVWKEGMAKWMKAEAVDGLLPAAPPGVAPPPLPDADNPLMLTWRKLYKNKPAFFGAAFGVALILSPVVSKILGLFPDGLDSFLHFMYALFVIGLFGALVVTGMKSLHGASMRAERLKSLWGKWEPVSGKGCSLWFYQDGGFLRNDGFGAKYTFDQDNDIIMVNVAGFGQSIPLQVITITKHELIVDCGGQALHFRKGKTITDERWDESVEKTKVFLKQAALVTGAVTVGVIGLGVVVLGAAAVAAGGVAGAAAAGGGGYGGGEGGRGGGSGSGDGGRSGPKYIQVPCPSCGQKGHVPHGDGSMRPCGTCGGKGFNLHESLPGGGYVV